MANTSDIRIGVSRLRRRFDLPFELEEQNDGSGAYFKLVLHGRVLARGRGKATFAALLVAFEEGMSCARTPPTPPTKTGPGDV